MKSNHWWVGAFAATCILGGSSIAQGQTMGPNLTVHNLQAPQVVGFGSIRIEADVCNVGDAFTPGTDLFAVVSTDSTADINDPPVGSAPVNGLAPGQCETILIDGFSPVPPGIYTLGVIVDPFDSIMEFDELDNTQTQPIGFGPEPDLFTLDLTTPPNAEGPFMATAIVCNQGASFASGVTVDLYASTDNVIEPPPVTPVSNDVLLGSSTAFIGPDSCESV
ncbi:MAG: CARDB domain-containing protein, partial [Myxococcota bacterium]